MEPETARQLDRTVEIIAGEVTRADLDVPQHRALAMFAVAGSSMLARATGRDHALTVLRQCIAHVEQMDFPPPCFRA